MRGDEARVVDAFVRWLEADGWAVEREIGFADVVAEREGERLYAEAKGRTTSPGLDADTSYGQLLRRMPIAEEPGARFAAVVPEEGLAAALHVPESVRRLLRIEIFTVDALGYVRRLE